MGAVTLTNLIARTRSRADMPVVGFVSAQECLDWINEGCQAVHEKLVSAYGEQYLFSTATLTTLASGLAPLPAGFFKLLGLEMAISGRTRTLLPYMQQERNLYKNAISVGLSPPKYALLGSNVNFLPIQPTGTQITINYAPEFTLLANPGDTTTFPNGWEKYAIAHAARQMLMKEESDVLALDRDLLRWDVEFEELKQSRDAAAPRQSIDVESVELENIRWP